MNVTSRGDSYLLILACFDSSLYRRPYQSLQCLRLPQPTLCVIDRQRWSVWPRSNGHHALFLATARRDTGLGFIPIHGLVVLRHASVVHLVHHLCGSIGIFDARQFSKTRRQQSTGTQIHHITPSYQLDLTWSERFLLVAAPLAHPRVVRRHCPHGP